jgi:hypothetical protein
MEFWKDAMIEISLPENEHQQRFTPIFLLCAIN